MDDHDVAIIAAVLIQRQNLIAACLAPPAVFMEYLEMDNVSITRPILSPAALHVPAVRRPRVDITTWDDRLARLRMRFTIPELRQSGHDD
jgi:hypothetical protein